MRQLGSEYRRLSNGKTVALLLGDSLGDAHMADGLEGLSAVCRIGFLNEEGARQVGGAIKKRKKGDGYPPHPRAIDSILSCRYLFPSLAPWHPSIASHAPDTPPDLGPSPCAP